MEKLFSFDGRIGRGTYWKYSLVLAAVQVVLWAVFAMTMGNRPLRTYDWYTGEMVYNTEVTVWLLAFAVVSLPIWIASLAAGTRRWHDHDKSGWWVLVGLVPVVGGLYSFAMLGCIEGDSRSNSYGPPEGGGSGEFVASGSAWREPLRWSDSPAPAYVSPARSPAIPRRSTTQAAQPTDPDAPTDVWPRYRQWDSGNGNNL